MLHLYRSANELQYWFVFEKYSGWMRFPAKLNGWGERRAVEHPPRDLRRVPLWLSFNTGLLESLEPRTLRHAA